ncbi:MAG: hypothetical protein JWM64_323, partial [Frankiales bacterium]|nr:hypothetical protein [Frankiales bacterium]
MLCLHEVVRTGRPSGSVAPATGRAPPYCRAVTRARLLTAAAVAGVVVQAVLAHRSAGPGGILERRYGLLLLLGVWSLVSAATVLCVLRLPRRTAIALLLLGAVVVRLAALSPKAPLSDDLYRNAWDCVVQSEGIDPYRHAPEAEQLAHLRYVPGMEWIWPPSLRGT